MIWWVQLESQFLFSFGLVPILTSQFLLLTVPKNQKAVTLPKYQHSIVMNKYVFKRENYYNLLKYMIKSDNILHLTFIINIPITEVNKITSILWYLLMLNIWKFVRLLWSLIRCYVKCKRQIISCFTLHETFLHTVSVMFTL